MKGDLAVLTAPGDHSTKVDGRPGVIDGSLVAGHYENAVDRPSAHEQPIARARQERRRARRSPLEAAATSAACAMGSEVGRRVIRGVLGSILGARC